MRTISTRDNLYPKFSQTEILFWKKIWMLGKLREFFCWYTVLIRIIIINFTCFWNQRLYRKRKKIFYFYSYFRCFIPLQGKHEGCKVYFGTALKSEGYNFVSFVKQVFMCFDLLIKVKEKDFKNFGKSFLSFIFIEFW